MVEIEYGKREKKRKGKHILIFESKCIIIDTVNDVEKAVKDLKEAISYFHENGLGGYINDFSGLRLINKGGKSNAKA